MQAGIVILVFVAVSVGMFALLSLFDRRHAQARLLRDRLTSAQKAPESTLKQVELVRDEMMSRIPALDAVLRRSERVSMLQKMLTQGHVDIRAGNFLML